MKSGTIEMSGDCSMRLALQTSLTVPLLTRTIDQSAHSFLVTFTEV